MGAGVPSILRRTATSCLHSALQRLCFLHSNRFLFLQGTCFCLLQGRQFRTPNSPSAALSCCCDCSCVILFLLTRCRMLRSQVSCNVAGVNRTVAAQKLLVFLYWQLQLLSQLACRLAGVIGLGYMLVLTLRPCVPGNSHDGLL